MKNINLWELKELTHSLEDVYLKHNHIIGTSEWIIIAHDHDICYNSWIIFFYLYDENWNKICEIQCNEIWPFNEWLAKIKKDWKIWFIDKKWNIVIDYIYTAVLDDESIWFKNWLAPVLLDDNWLFIDNKWNIKLKLEKKYDLVSDFINGYAKVLIWRKYNIDDIDFTKTLSKIPDLSKIDIDISKQLYGEHFNAILWTELLDNGAIVWTITPIIDAEMTDWPIENEIKSRVLEQNEIDHLLWFDEEIEILEKWNRWLIDLNGSEILPCSYLDIYQPIDSNMITLLHDDLRYKYFNTSNKSFIWNGTTTSSCQKFSIWFSEWLWLIIENWKQYYINENWEKILWPFNSELNCWPFKNWFALIWSYFKCKYYFINKKWEKCFWDFIYAQSFSEWFAVVRNNYNKNPYHINIKWEKAFDDIDIYYEYELWPFKDWYSIIFLWKESMRTKRSNAERLRLWMIWLIDNNWKLIPFETSKFKIDELKQQIIDLLK